MCVYIHLMRVRTLLENHRSSSTISMAENGHGTAEEQLRQGGRRLLDLQLRPSPVDEELITLLDEIAHWLSLLELLSPEELEASISPLPRALVSNRVIWNSNMDANVAVACCLCEILRITAPQPYYQEDDGTLKVVLELIVHCLKDLSDKSSPSYQRRIRILEIISNHRVGALLLDYDCEVLAAEMFDIFIDSISDDQPSNFLSLMETAMIEVIELFEDNEDISAELIAPLLAALRKDNQEIQPIAVELAKNVIENCADKLRPNLIEAMKYLDTSLDDYCDLVASICNGRSGSESDNRSSSSSDIQDDIDETQER